MLVHICQQEFQLTPNFTYDRIDEGRDQHLCKIDFQGILISTGKGHSKTESKKQAAQNALKRVSPKIYKEVFGIDSEPK